MSTHPQQHKKTTEFLKLNQFLNPQTITLACEYPMHYDKNLEAEKPAVSHSD